MYVCKYVNHQPNQRNLIWKSVFANLKIDKPDELNCKIWDINVLKCGELMLSVKNHQNWSSFITPKIATKFPLSLGSYPNIIGLWALAQTPIFLAFELWLKHLYYCLLSHGSNIHITGLWAMAQTSKLLDFEPWFKLINYWTLSHGSNTSIIRLWATLENPLYRQFGASERL